MNNQLLRNTIINLLDDDHGLNSAGHNGIVEICIAMGWEDINSATKITDDRAYLTEEAAQELLKVAV